MSQRNSEYARMGNDHYATPCWVVSALLSVEDFSGYGTICEAAPGEGHMVDALRAHGLRIGHSHPSEDFLSMGDRVSTAIITNPPYSKAEAFVRQAIKMTQTTKGKVAMLLPLAFDSAKTRRDLFEDHPFKAKYTLTKRIRWENLEQKKNGPSQNHAWFVWDWSYTGKPFLGYLPKAEAIGAAQ